MALFYRHDIEQPPKDEANLVTKIGKRIASFSEYVPTKIRSELATLAAEVNGKTDELKQATKEKATALREEIRTKTRSLGQESIREDAIGKLKGRKKHEKLLSHAESFDGVRAGDLLRMRAAGGNIANFLLTDEDGDEINLTDTTAESYKNKTLLVNFGEKNNSINASIGLGDILPYDVKKVEVTKANGEKVIGTLGYQDSRKGRRDRVGYYDQNGVYIAIYRGYSVKILDTGRLSEEDRKKYDDIQMTHMQELRVREMLIRRDMVGEKYKEEFTDEQDQALFSRVEQAAKNQEARRERHREAYGKALGKERFLQLFGGYLNEVCAKYDVPPKLVMRLFEKENPTFDFTKKNPKSSAHGFGQIIDDTWSDVENKILGIDLDRFDPKDQILASVAILAKIKRNQNVGWARTGILYHAGEGLLGKSKETINSDLTKNGVIAQYFRGSPEMSQREYAEEYAKAAEKYYGFSEITDTGYVHLEVPKTGLPLKGMVSHPIEYTPSGTTACSRTAWRNLGEFGIDSPRGGSANESESQQTGKKHNQSELIASKGYNIADMYVDSNTEKGSQYGHRAMVVKGIDNIWYAMDPYNNAKNPIPLDEYLTRYSRGTPNPRFYPAQAKNYLAKEILAQS